MLESGTSFFKINKVIVVIGGTGIVGKAIIECLLKAGATVISVSRNTNEKGKFQKENLGNKFGGFRSFFCDVTTEDGIKELNDFLRVNFLLPNVLVNALSFRPADIYLSDSIEKWDQVVYKNSRSIYMLYRLFANLMAENGGGSVINISTIYAVVAPDPGIYDDIDMGTEADYPFIKGGAISLTRYFASYYAKKKVRFNSIILGGVFNNQPSTFVRRYINKVPLGRMANPNDICGVVNLLASDSSEYITGASIPVDGGYTLR